MYIYKYYRRHIPCEQSYTHLEAAIHAARVDYHDTQHNPIAIVDEIGNMVMDYDQLVEEVGG